MLDGPNWQAWSVKMQAYLTSVDLWLITNGSITHPTAAGEEQSRWDISDSRAIGMITLTLKDHVHRRLYAIISAAVANATDRHASTWWTTLRMEYGTISPTQVYDLLKSSLNFHIDGSKHPHPQLDVLENIHADLTTNGVELPDFFRSMMLLTCLPPAWESSIIQTVMAQGTVLGITWDLTKWTILWYWDTEQAKRMGHRSPAVHKLSAVKKHQGPPSFRS
jgi:hypothetical protein